jgi:hypothetical protein
MNKYQLADLRREQSRARRMLIEFFVYFFSGVPIVLAIIIVWAKAETVNSFFTWVASEVVKFFVL